MICVRLFVAAETRVPIVEPFDVALVFTAVIAATAVTDATVLTVVTVDTVVTPVTAVTVPIFHVPDCWQRVANCKGGVVVSWPVAKVDPPTYVEHLKRTAVQPTKPPNI